VTPSEIVVVVAGLATIAWINWYFFLAERRTAQAVVAGGGVQEVTITVAGGYEPAAVQVRAGQPVRLLFDRQETSGCSEEVVLPAFGIRRFLAPFETTPVEFTPAAPGTYEFTCGMSMLRGRVTVVDGQEG
jgi:plastocyanin domain-containing protein